MNDSADAFGTAFWGDEDDAEALQWFRSLVKTIDDGVFQLDAAGRFVAVNDVIADVTGYDRETLLGEPVSVLYDDVSTIENEIDRVLANPTERGELLELIFSTAGGGQIPCELRLNPITVNGTLAGIVGVVRDISGRKRTSQRVSEPEQRHKREWELERYETIIDTVSDGVYTLDADSHFMMVNDAFVELVGYSREELLGEPASLVHSDAIDAEASRKVEELRTGEREVAIMEVTTTTADGEAVPVESRMSPFPYADGEYGRVGVVRDVTERKEREKDLRATQEQLEVATRAASVGLWTWDIQADVVTADEYLAESHGMDPEEVAAGAPMEAFYEPIHEDDEERTWGQLESALEETGELETEYRVRDADGDIRWVLARGAVEYDEDIEPVRMNGAISDITERKQAEMNLRKSEERFRTIMEQSPLSMQIFDAEGRTIAANPAWERLWDAPREELDDYNVLEDEQLQAAGLLSDIRKAFAGEVVTLPVTHYDPAEIGKPGRDRWIEGYAYPLTADDEEMSEVVLVHHDITARKRAEEALRESEEHLNAIVETTPECIKVVDADGTLLEMNPAGLDMVGADSGSSVIGGCVYDLIAPEHRQQFREFNERICTGNSGTLEFDIIGLDGKRRHTETHAAPLRSPDGPITQLALTRDITERKERERQLEESEQRYRALIENFPNGAVALVDEDLRYRIAGGTPIDVEANTWEDLEGYPIREAISEELADVLVPRYRAALDGEASSFEHEHDGKHSQIRIFPVRDGDGEVFAAMGMSQDFSDLKERERALLESEQRYRTLAENFPDGGVGVFDENLQYTLVTGTMWDDIEPDAADLEGETIWDALPPDTADDVEPIFRDALEGETGSVVSTLDGQTYQVWATPLRDADGEITAGQSFALDITDQLERERKLEASNERLEQFAYAASHDLQEPLRMVSSYLQLIEQRYADELDEDGEEFIGFAVDGADRMRDMIGGLLEYSRVDTRGDPFEPVDLDAVLADVRADLKMQIEESDAEVTADSLPRVHGDEGQLRQVFQNLLDNAIEYSDDEPPRVNISAEQDRSEWAISVRDEGIGIDPDDANRVFEVFQSLHTNDEHPGTGIGLALSERVIERHGGDIWVDSELGEGATFTFTLPVASEQNE